MLKSIREWWNTPMVSEAVALDLARDCVKHEDENIQLRADVDEAKAERDAMQLERDKATGRFEYVEARNKDLEKMLADRDAYIKFLEDQARHHLAELNDDGMDDFEDDMDDMSDIDDLCDECGLEVGDCDCDDDLDDEDDVCPCCGNDM